METTGTVNRRWERAYAKAEGFGAQARQLAGSGAWIVASASSDLTAYESSVNQCSCPAGEHGRPCWHVAAVRLTIQRQRIAELETAGWEASPADIDCAVKAAAWLTEVGASALTVCPLCDGQDAACLMCGGEGTITEGRELEIRREIDRPYDMRKVA